MAVGQRHVRPGEVYLSPIGQPVVVIRWGADLGSALVTYGPTYARRYARADTVIRRGVPGLRFDPAATERIEGRREHARDLLRSLILDLSPLEHPHQLPVS